MQTHPHDFENKNGKPVFKLHFLAQNTLKRSIKNEKSEIKKFPAMHRNALAWQKMVTEGLVNYFPITKLIVANSDQIAFFHQRVSDALNGTYASSYCI